jgi:hypothetical protein
VRQARGIYNSRMPSRLIRKTRAHDAGERTLEMTVRRMSISARPRDRILKVGRTVADLDHEAELLLRRCNRAYIVGYSPPDDDLEVIDLLRRGLEGLEGKHITVVTAGDNEAIRGRYVSLFGRHFDWQPIGFLQWMKEQALATTASA